MNKYSVFFLVILLISCNYENKKKLKYERVISYESISDFKIKTEYYEINDTSLIKNQVWYFKANSNIIDSLKGKFYKLKRNKHSFKKNGNYTITGKLNLYHKNENIESPLDETYLRLWIGYYKNKKLNYYEFNSTNKNVIEFEYENDNDTLFGILFITKTYDTIVNNKKMLRYTEDAVFIDNEMQTDNPFIDVFATKKEYLSE